MSTENVNDRLSIKNILFTRAIPNYVIPESTDGYQVYGCVDCGDKFLLQSSYSYHIQRKSMNITYMCRHCSQLKIFKNRCNLLAHIRSHSFKTTTINIGDLKIEPLGPEHFVSQNNVPKKRNRCICPECKEDITKTGVMYKDRMNHFMAFTNQQHICPICMFEMPSKCGLAAHLRIHFKMSPIYCPECGLYLKLNCLNYPYNHDCHGFRMMRATARVKCPFKMCHSYICHPNEIMKHLRTHTIKVFKCPHCIVACFSEEAIVKHLRKHDGSVKCEEFYQCAICPGRLISYNQIGNHLKSHSECRVFICWSCNKVFSDMNQLMQHHETENCRPQLHLDNNDAQVAQPACQPNNGNAESDDQSYRVVKKCDRCNRSFRYICKFQAIPNLPNECPYKCSPGDHNVSEVSRMQNTTDQNVSEVSRMQNTTDHNVSEVSRMQTTMENENANAKPELTCHFCKMKISQEWKDIKLHFAEHHKAYRCLDITVNLTRLNAKKTTAKVFKRKAAEKLENVPGRKNSSKVSTDEDDEAVKLFPCTKCQQTVDTKRKLEEHIIQCHRDACTAYQCLECGQCFVVKPSFSTHLLLEHGISDVDQYVTDKPCYNSVALMNNHGIHINEEPLKENQCNICRDQFDGHDELEKHYRVHGMAFLMKNTLNKNPSP